MSDSYFAGLIDGEGSIGLYSGGKGKRRRVRMKVNMTCRVTIEAILAHFNVGHVRPHKVPEGRKPQWAWACSDRAARVVLERIAPYSITKRALILQLLKG